jgi:hypothetical protein
MYHSFTCLIPLRICEAIPETLSAAAEEVQRLRKSLTSTPPVAVFVYSPSTSTQRLIKNCLRGMTVNMADSLDKLKTQLSSLPNQAPNTLVIYPTAVVVDGMQDEVDAVVAVMDSVPALRRTPVIQLIARSMTTMHRPSPPNPIPSDTAPHHVARCSKPLRAAAFLRCIAEAHGSPATLDLTLQIPFGSSATTSPSGSTPTPRIATTTLPSPSTAPPKTSSFFTEDQLSDFKNTQFLIAEGQSSFAKQCGIC